MDRDILHPADEALYVPIRSEKCHPQPLTCSINIIEVGYLWLENVSNLIGKENYESTELIS